MSWQLSCLNILLKTFTRWRLRRVSDPELARAALRDIARFVEAHP